MFPNLIVAFSSSILFYGEHRSVRTTEKLNKRTSPLQRVTNHWIVAVCEKPQISGLAGPGRVELGSRKYERKF